MQPNAWAALLSHIPIEQHSKLMLMTSSGMEIAVQNLLRIEEEFLAFKGRMAGSQDQGRLFFIPFGNIEYINFNYAVKDEEFHEMFGALKMPDAPSPGVTVTVSPPVPPPGGGVEEPLVSAPAANLVVEPPAAEVQPLPQPEPQPAAPVSPSSRTPLKSAVLERFRSRGLPGGGADSGPPADSV